MFLLYRKGGTGNGTGLRRNVSKRGKIFWRHGGPGFQRKPLYQDGGQAIDFKGGKYWAERLLSGKQEGHFTVAIHLHSDTHAESVCAPFILVLNGKAGNTQGGKVAESVNHLQALR